MTDAEGEPSASHQQTDWRLCEDGETADDDCIPCYLSAGVPSMSKSISVHGGRSYGAVVA